MNDRLYTHGEIVVITNNLREIEKNLGHPIPGGMIDLSSLKSRTLRPGEVNTICQNIRSMERGYISPSNHNGRDMRGITLIDIVLGFFLLTGLSLLASLFNFLF